MISIAVARPVVKFYLIVITNLSTQIKIVILLQSELVIVLVAVTGQKIVLKRLLESFFENKKLLLRSPDANRPWQHVIEPLIGYLMLAEKLFSKEGKNFVGAWNFGPSTKQNMKVLNLAKLIKQTINSKSKIIIKKKDKRFSNKKYKVFESKYLNIDSRKAFKKLRWRPRLSIKNSVKLTVEWHKDFLQKKNLLELSTKQLKRYITKNL